MSTIATVIAVVLAAIAVFVVESLRRQPAWQVSDERLAQIGWHAGRAV